MTMTDVTATDLLGGDLWHGRINIGGWREGRGGTTPVIEPATGNELGSIGVATRDDVEEAARVAASAQSAWAATSPEERAAVLRRAGLLWEQHAAELDGWIMRETGAIGPKAGLETHIAAQECFEASALATAPHGEVLTSSEQHWSFARRRAAGVVSVIAPFNFPVILAIRAVAPALALGNTVLLKPDLRTAICGGVAIVRVFEEAGLPPGVLSLLPGDGEIGAAVVEAPEVRVIAFTGSTAAGRRVGEAAARHLKRAHLELGGNNALIVLPGADLELAVSAGAFGAFMHQGQICMTAGRHLVHESLAPAYVEALAAKAAALPMGNPATEQVALGPIIDAGQMARIDGIVSSAVAAGARLVVGGSPQGRFYPATVLSDVKPDNPAWREEIFGPVAPVLSFSTIEEAVALANDTEYGLSVGVLGDVGEAMKVADQLVSGKVHINEQTVSDEATAPFGGMKSSGNGSRIGGVQANLDSFTELQWLTVRPDIAPYPF